MHLAVTGQDEAKPSDAYIYAFFERREIVNYQITIREAAQMLSVVFNPRTSAVSRCCIYRKGCVGDVVTVDENQPIAITADGACSFQGSNVAGFRFSGAVALHRRPERALSP